jgi:Tol biopolymer transport system component
MRLWPAVVLASLSWAQREPVASHITVISIDGKHREVVYSAPKLFEAPNWSPDGRYLLVNSEGRLWKIGLKSRVPEPVETGAINRINNDHGISPDGKWFVISAGHLYLLPASGGTPRQLTEHSPSYYHGWSPDGRRLTFCARRGENFDIYDIAVEGGPERRLTTHPGYDDGPDYSPDGRWIYFNSNRSGSWDIWRIPADGAAEGDAKAERITSDEREDWFPHPSPDGRWIVFLSYEKGTEGHPPNRNVTLRRMPVVDGRPRADRIEIVTELFGGQGTINVNSWAPDSRRFAFVSYSKLQ